MSVRGQRAGPVAGVSQIGAGLSGATVGVKHTYTCPPNRQAKLLQAAVANFTGAPTVQFRLTLGGVTVVLASPTALLNISLTVFLEAGDKLEFNVSGAVAGTVFDALISVEEYEVLS